MLAGRGPWGQGAAAAAMSWPFSTNHTATCLNSSVYLYRPRFAFAIFVSLSPLKQLAKGYVLQW